MRNYCFIRISNTNGNVIYNNVGRDMKKKTQPSHLVQ